MRNGIEKFRDCIISSFRFIISFNFSFTRYSMKKISVVIVLFSLLPFFGCAKKSQNIHVLREAKGGKKYGGAIHLNENGDLRSLDPPQINDQTSSHIGENVYDRLLEFDNKLNLHPALAKALPDIS